MTPAITPFQASYIYFRLPMPLDTSTHVIAPAMLSISLRLFSPRHFFLAYYSILYRLMSLRRRYLFSLYFSHLSTG